ncbi:hypothetical protein D7147_23085 [Micromonospora musae]|uniref:Uncharacterized protein n=1 Tax=Micromonospora musae TaxID=1894970 RepID=A0A3A9Y4Z8_9ACTN|nr:hypothetical protein D7147_23085 [Micromonospora musae]RKN32418.1 hypothetical protein D7044_14375 [Micromonospora musae]
MDAGPRGRGVGDGRFLTAASPLQREIGRFQRDVQKVVVSDTLTDREVSAHPATVVRPSWPIASSASQ